MANRIILSPAWCDDHLTNCWQSYNEANGETRHIQYYTDEAARLKEYGYVYTGHCLSEYYFRLDRTQPLIMPLDWQMAQEQRRAEFLLELQNQEW